MLQISVKIDAENFSKFVAGQKVQYFSMNAERRTIVLTCEVDEVVIENGLGPDSPTIQRKNKNMK